MAGTLPGSNFLLVCTLYVAKAVTEIEREETEKARTHIHLVTTQDMCDDAYVRVSLAA